MGTHLADSVESFANKAAATLSRPRPRMSQLLILSADWNAICGLVPQEARADEVGAALAAAIETPASITRCREAIARYALWYEGYSFGR